MAGSKKGFRLRFLLVFEQKRGPKRPSFLLETVFCHLTVQLAGAYASLKLDALSLSISQSQVPSPALVNSIAAPFTAELTSPSNVTVIVPVPSALIEPSTEPRFDLTNPKIGRES